MPLHEEYKYSQKTALKRGARWALEDEIKRTAHMVCLSDPNSDFRGGLPMISDGDTVYLDSSDTHSLIIGSTGSKKSRLFAMPMLELFRKANESVVVSDPKGELYNLTAKAYRDAGYNIMVLNLRDPSRSHGWSPLALARRRFCAGDDEMAASIINDFSAALFQDKPGSKVDPFWNHASRAMFQGLAMLLVEGTDLFETPYVNMRTLKSLGDTLFLASDDNDERQKCNTYKLLRFLPEDSLARSNLQAIIVGSDKTFDNIKASYNAPIQQLYIQKSLIRMLSSDMIDFTELGRQKSILYLILPDEKTTLHFIASLMIKQCYEQLIWYAQSCEGGVIPRRINFLLDEFSNLPAISDMPSMISAARSRNMRFHVVIQGMNQLSSKYGADDAHTIKGNCGNWVFLTSRELPLLQEISALCGMKASGEALITVSQLQHLSKERGEALMLMGRNHPFIAHMADISEYAIASYGAPLALPELPQDNPLCKTSLSILTKYRSRAEQENADRAGRRFNSVFGNY